MNIRDQKARDWVMVHCTPSTGDNWVWPSGYQHSEQESVRIARMCQALGREPSDIVSSELFDDLVNRVITIEERLNDGEEKTVT